MRFFRWQKFLLFVISSWFLIFLLGTYYSDTEEDTQFWYIEYIFEQLGKTKFHFAEQVLIAHEVRRTLILPNVGQSQMGMRYPFSFDFYYERKSLSSKFSVISPTDFRSHMSRLANRNRRVTAAIIYILIDGQCATCTMAWSDVQSEFWYTIFATYNMELLSNPACFETIYGTKAPLYPQPIIDFLRRNHSKTDIIVTLKNSYLF